MIGDVIGKPGRLAVKAHLPKLRDEKKIDFVTLNAENSAGGVGVTPEIAREYFDWGVDVLTTGNHVWQKREIIPFLESEQRILRPANYPRGTPGRGSVVVDSRGGVRVGVVNIQGRVYMPQFLDCPFASVDAILRDMRGNADVILVDVHCEATSEKGALGRHLDGRVAAAVGTHTHVQTADETIFPGGTAFITDIGMTGPFDSIIGVRKELVLRRFMTQMPLSFEVASDDVRFQAVLITIDPSTGKSKNIERIHRRTPA